MNIKNYMPRNWQIWLMAIIAVLFVLPEFDFQKFRTFLGLFFAMSVASWGVLRVYWTERTVSVKGNRLIARELSYALITCFNCYAAAHISL